MQMEPANDGELLQRQVEHGDEAAFAEIVRRHVDMVYSTARRLGAGNAHFAEDISQQVFTTLARKARQLTGHPTLVGWLHITTRNLACKAIRTENRRRVREQEIFAMQNTRAQPEIQWDALQPLLDEAVSRLGQSERDALLLRYFEGKSHREVGEMVGLNEEAARKRVDRALDKLRAYFSRGGVTVSAGLLAEAVTTHAVSAAPVGLADGLTSTALANASAAPVGLAVLAKFFITMSTTTKITLGIAALVAVVASYQHFVHADDLAPANPAPANGPAAPAAVSAPALPAKPAPAVAAAPAPERKTSVAAMPAGSATPSMTASGAATPESSAQKAQALLVSMKQTFVELSQSLKEASDLDAAREKMNALDTQMNDLRAEVAGTPLEAQLTPAVNALKAVQSALQKDDVDAARAVLEKLAGGGPKVPPAKN